MRARHVLQGVAFLVSGTYAASPPVKVSLRSSWPAPPFLLELIETLSVEQPDTFFSLLDALTDPEALPVALSPNALREKAFEVAVSKHLMVAEGAQQITHLDLALHSTTPKIEALYQYYRDTAHARGASRDPERCGSWVDWYGEVVCDAERLKELAEAPSDPPRASPRVLPFDHVHPPSTKVAGPLPTAVLYGDLTSSNFRTLHTRLWFLASSSTPQLQYIFRPIPPSSSDASHTYLSGYGVALHLKKTDYLALDDRLAHKDTGSGDGTAAKAVEVKPESDYVLPLLERYELNTTFDATVPLTGDELTHLGAQAVQLAMNSQEPLATLKQLVQNFPKYTASLARRVVVQEDITQEITQNSFRVSPGVSSVWLNGAAVSDPDLEPFKLLGLLRKERDIMSALTSLGMQPSEALDLITEPSLAGGSAQGVAFEDVFDASDRPEDGDLIIYWNDIEKDSRYARWPDSLYAILRPTYPGQVPAVRLNLFHTILVLDLTKIESLQFLANTVTMVISRSFPVRFGLVPIVETDAGEKLAKLVFYMVENYGRGKAMELFRKIVELPSAHPEQVDLARARAAFEAVVATAEVKEGGVALDFDIVVDGSTDAYQAKLDKAHAYASRLGVSLAAGPEGHAFINGQYFIIDDTFLSQLQATVSKGLTHVQEAIYDGSMNEESAVAIANHFYDLPTALTRRNRHIVPSSNAGGARVVDLYALFRDTDFHISDAAFVYPEAETVPSTMYLVADLDSESGLAMVQTALTFVATATSRSRVSFIHNPTSPFGRVGSRTRGSSIFSHLICQGLLEATSADGLLKAFGLHLAAGHGGQTALGAGATFAKIMGGVAVDDVDAADYARYVQASANVVRKLGLRPGATAIVLNGRVIGHVEAGGFAVEDFQILEDYETAKRVDPVLKALEVIAPQVLNSTNRAAYARVVSHASSLVASIQTSHATAAGQPRVFRTHNYRMLDSQHTTFELGDRLTAVHRFAVVLDPLSEQAQRYTSLFEWLSSIPTVHVEIHLQPPPYHELPLKRFYRYNLLSKNQYDSDGHELPSHAVFRDLPIEPIYTLALDEPSSWLVRPKKALYDLDNIQLGVLSPKEREQGVDAIFELDYLIAGGHARESHTNNPPRGVQLQLTTSNSVPVDDTLIVANLGYLQFKATPGVYQLEIREGRGREVFKLESAGNGGWDSGSVDEVGSEITLTSFEGLTLYPRLTRLPGMENSDVLEVEIPQQEPVSFVEDVVHKISSLFKSKDEPETFVSPSRHAEINIFTVASGLLYERFASIMILSVLRNTNHSVKFWFIENFLSPSFLEFIPHFAEEYGFQYELVTYKWPTWLRHQTEKQRIIWAYKILFLDVLFPMDLDKVIFVDADQIVRADLKELIDLDLHGAPYGYTPMGDDNTDMEGFRFWKTGYWEEFLRGRPYHISALYVIDLVRFRQLAAGDILRSQYQQLSADPNSLANLDQDLPNNLQGHIPIYSLHEDWLWCETWCSKDRLHRAKTIDLCQNPLTKEPKLSRARQIPEWEVYDSEIARFARKLADEGRILATAAAADINELANAGAAGPAETPAGSEGQEGQIVDNQATPPVRDEL